MKKNERGFAVIEFVIIVLVIGAMVGVGYFVLQSKNKRLKTVEEQKRTTQNQLSAAQAKIDHLDNPTMKANNEKRKVDLALFTATVKQYKVDSGTFPSTEPSSFKKQFADVFVTGKLPNFVDPNTKQAYELIPVATSQTPPGLTLGSIQYQWAGECVGSEFKDTIDDSKAAARILLETGETYCLNV